MNSQQQRTVEMFRRVLGWFNTNLPIVAQAASASVPALSSQVDALKGIVERATNHATTQQTQFAQSQLISKDEREQRRVLLATHMTAVAKLGRALGGQVPGIRVLTMPRGSVHTATLVTFATAMARKAEIYKSVLVEHGLPADFVEQIDAAAANLKASLDARGDARAARAGATRGLESEIATGMRVVSIMDATLSRVVTNNPSKMAEWRQLKRIVQKGAQPAASAQAVESSRTQIQGTPAPAQVTPMPVAATPTEVQRAA